MSTQIICDCCQNLIKGTEFFLSCCRDWPSKSTPRTGNWPLKWKNDLCVDCFTKIAEGIKNSIRGIEHDRQA